MLFPNSLAAVMHCAAICPYKYNCSLVVLWLARCAMDAGVEEDMYVYCYSQLPVSPGLPVGGIQLRYELAGREELVHTAVQALLFSAAQTVGGLRDA